MSLSVCVWLTSHSCSRYEKSFFFPFPLWKQYTKLIKKSNIIDRKKRYTQSKSNIVHTHSHTQRFIFFLTKSFVIINTNLMTSLLFNQIITERERERLCVHCVGGGCGHLVSYFFYCCCSHFSTLSYPGFVCVCVCV